MDTIPKQFQIIDGFLITKLGRFSLSDAEGLDVETRDFGIFIQIMVIGVGGAFILQVILANPIPGLILLIPYVMFMFLKRVVVVLCRPSGRTIVAEYITLSRKKDQADQFVNDVTEAIRKRHYTTLLP